MTHPHIPEPTIETKKGKTLTYTETTWTVGPYQLVRQASEDVQHPPQWNIHTTDRNAPDVYDMSGLFASTAKYGVNWPGKGVTPPTETRAFAIYLMQAAHSADIFTAIRAQNPDHE